MDAVSTDCAIYGRQRHFVWVCAYRCSGGWRGGERGATVALCTFQQTVLDTGPECLLLKCNLPTALRSMRLSALAAYSGVSAATLRKWVLTKRLPAWRCAKRHYADTRPRGPNAGMWRVWEADVRRFLQERRGSQAIPDSAWKR